MMIKYLKLVRFPNLIIVALTMYLFRYGIMLPVMKHTDNIFPVFSHFSFALLVFSVLLIAAAGYIINDYFDLRADRINKPDKMLIGKAVSRRQAIFLHSLLNILGVVIGIYVSYHAGSFKLGLINVVVATLLWLYSVKYKAYFLVGNILVALLSALVIMVVWLFEISALNNHGIIPITSYKLLYSVMLGYFVFALLMSMIREIIKDIEDIEGDKKVGCSTMPVVIGIRKSQKVITFLSLVTLAGMVYISYIALTRDFALLFWYFSLAVCIPFIYMTYYSYIARTKSDFTFLSKLVKYNMISGVLSMVVVYINLFL